MPRRWSQPRVRLQKAWRSEGSRCSGPAGALRRRTSLPSRLVRSGAARRRRRGYRGANILTCGIGLPIAGVEGDMNGLRFGTPEIVRWGMTVDDMPALAALIARGLRGNESGAQVAADVTAFRARFRELHFVN